MALAKVGQLQHAMRDVETDGLRAARRDRERDVTGAGRQIERALARLDVRQRHQLRLPARILAVRQDRGDQSYRSAMVANSRADIAAASTQESRTRRRGVHGAYCGTLAI